jgi:predicted PurR-regulated permease PerM
VFMWNIVEPKFMGNKLNLSPLVIIIALWFWGTVWWIIGMLLSVPIMVIINIILAKIPATRNIAILLSEKWELQVDWGDEVVKTRRRVLKKITEKFSKKKK